MPYVHEMQGYIPVQGPTLFPSVTEERLKMQLPLGELNALRQHALCLACLQGNSFVGLIDQYLVDAYNNLWRNGSLCHDDTETGIKIRNLYPATAAEHWRQERDAKMRAYGIDPASPTAENDLFERWMSEQSPAEEASSGRGIAVVEDGYIQELILTDESLLDLAVAEVRKLVDHFKHETDAS